MCCCLPRRLPCCIEPAPERHHLGVVMHGCFYKLGALVGSPYGKDHSIGGSTWGPLIFGNSQPEVSASLKLAED